MERKIDRRLTYKKYKRKLNSILFLLIIPAVVMLGAFLVLYLNDIISMTHLGTIYMPLMITYLILVFIMTPNLYYYKMYANYSKLLLNKPKFLESSSQLFTSSWIDQLKSDGYNLVQEDMRHILLCKYYKKLSNSSQSDQTLVFIAIAKNREFDFYGDEIDNGIQAFYMKHKNYEKISKRITLQFKKYDIIDEKATAEVETAILYQAGKQIIINLTFAYCNDKGSLFGLYPEKWYPNRYTHFAFTECKRICDIKE
ncbi:MAG: hypothetical protein JEZ08_03275 [Clostridiales bacterium]|nr:hypothetical protein [Clostridiales bacterium]